MSHSRWQRGLLIEGRVPVALRNARGGRLGAGIYMIRVSAGSQKRTLRLVALD